MDLHAPSHCVTTKLHVFVVDGVSSIRADEYSGALKHCLPPDIHVDVVTSDTLDDALEAIPAQALRVGIVALGADRGDDVIVRLRREQPGLPIIVIAAAPGLIDLARWLGAGAVDYVTPPLTAVTIVPRILRAATAGKSIEDADANAAPQNVEGLVGRGPAFAQMIQEIRAVARCDATVLIQGETGTGKELCARAIHKLSARANRPLNAVNCGAIPRDLVENELFGHQRAAFTGASANQLGLIAASEGGSLFFDEVDAFGPGEQATLLRFVQSQEYRPLGATRVVKADVRVIAATNANLSERVRRGHFREDLFYRLDMLRLQLPALRERREDIPLLARQALRTFTRKFQARGRTFDDAAMEALVGHDWPGNVRQLEHVIGRAVAFAFHDEVITRAHLDLDRRTKPAEALSTSLREGKRRVIEDFERARVCACLAAHGGNIARAAQAAGKHRRAFWELMRKYGIRAEEFAWPAEGEPRERLTS